MREDNVGEGLGKQNCMDKDCDHVSDYENNCGSCKKLQLKLFSLYKIHSKSTRIIPERSGMYFANNPKGDLQC